ncbi:hypothetical protein O6H91_02G135600 [Diphasiastrum complanatum]|uniref:Uncharacterized protein n=3 Tax=Diphasiastrum complanatum TaxID=34168 RepID=A0ACC2ELC4_DIPCM|nr:hypothetical protein O6H91_02G135200 [Diphasiastrum complanatum]KAJ7567185.1 hypothetical protein O6H91_02G135200 [Diphasiastrum complanatum]KAJ7567189.1 hypothetical protein O6H91_02G135600 [Diphasiastrum complanatum]
MLLFTVKMGGLAATLIVTSLMLLQRVQICACFDYRDALEKSIMFYEAQRSGRLPPNQRVTWRANSGLEDGKTAGVDLEGGYYDAGDNVKFGMPMAYTITMLSWSTVAYRKELHNARQLGYVLDAIKWGTDYFIKAHPEPNLLWGEVGDGNTDHECWQRPEDMTTPRPAYRIDPRNPGSDLAGETAAAMAAASIAFRDSDASYSYSLLNHARQLFSFADTYRGKYDNSIQVAQKYYASKSGYTDELLWSAIWLYEATGDEYYLAYVANNAAALGGINWSMTEFSWDVKFAGVQVLASKVLLEGRGRRYASTLRRYQDQAEYFLCACLQKSYGAKVQRTPGGLMFVRSWNNMQYVTSASFLLTMYSDYLSSSRQQLNCHDSKVEPFELLELAKSQVDYILGNNPRATSYMVGFGDNYPRQLHHRASSIVSYKVDSSFVSCRGGYATWYSRRQSDPNVLVGALVGGPDQNDNFADQRENYEQTEPATYNNGPMVGVLARLLTFRSYNEALQGGTR